MLPAPPTAVPDGAVHVSAVPWWRHSWLGQDRDRFMHLAPLAAVLLFLAVIMSAFWYLRLEEIRREQEAVKRDVDYSQQRLRLRLLERQSQLMRLARDIANGDIDRAQFEAHAEALVAQYPELIALSWLDERRKTVAIQVSPSVNANRPWMDNGALKASQIEAGFGSARDLLQPVYSPPIATKGAEAVLQLHVPITPHGHFAGELLAEYSVDALLRYGVPVEILAKYATSLLDSQGQMLAGQNIPNRLGMAKIERPPWASKINQFDVPVSPIGNGLIFRAQAWRTSQGVVGGTLFWLVIVLAVMTAWMLLTNWRQSQRRQQAQLALEAETSFRRAMENSMITGMRALDMQGHIIYVNPAFCRMTGWSEEDLIGKSEAFPYWPDEDTDVLSDRLAEELRGAGNHQPGLQMRVKRKDDTLFDARLYVSPLIDGAGKQAGWMASMTDITEPNRVRRQLS
jgi:PAS domain S-box-containing protein